MRNVLAILIPAGDFVMGQAEDRETALALVRRYQEVQQVQAAWEANQRVWNDLLGSVQVHTPEPAFDILVNRWLLYQTLSCRIWGRTAFYQSSGAYGFRDQLQDILALLHVAPQLAREHLLRAARHQFEAGDVLHWWHPPSGRGMRTRISDDMLWLPYVTAEYVSQAGVSAQVSLRSGDMLNDDLGSGYDIVMLNAICHMFSEEQNRGLFRRIYPALAPNGRLVVQDFILNPDKTGPLHAALFSLNMLVATEAGASYSELEYTDWMKAAGFTDVCRINLPGPSDLIVGRVT